MSGKTTIAVTVRSHANLMQLLQYIRHQAETTTVFLVLDGYLGDPRTLHEIPEVRKMCLRLLDTGVASHLAASSIAAGAPITSARAVGHCPGVVALRRRFAGQPRDAFLSVIRLMTFHVLDHWKG